MGGPRQIIARGQSRCIRDWSKIVGINEATIASRLKVGWTVEDALSIPARAVVKPFVPRDLPPPPPCTVDPDAWLMQVWNDPRRCGRVFELAFAVHLAVKRGMWPLSVSDIGREANMHRRTIQRLIPALEHCGHVQRSYACQCRVDIILIDKSAPPAPLAIAAE